MSHLLALIDQLEGQLRGNDVPFSGVSIDSRSISQGELFIAITGENFDGHDFVMAAKEQGAVAAIVSRPVAVDLPMLFVADPRLALGKLAALHRQQFHLPIIALTGSCGKTTVKAMIAAILEQLGITLAPQASFNNDIGVPLTLLRLTAEHRFAVIELGANHIGEIAYTTELVSPDVALITNIGPAHLAGFGSIAGVVLAKSEIFQGLTRAGVAIINADDPTAGDLRCLVPQGVRSVSFGECVSADFKAQYLEIDKQGRVTFSLRCSDGEIDIQLPLPGKHQMFNAVAAAGAAYSVGATLDAIKAGLENIQPIDGRLLIKQSQHGAKIIDDTYNANPKSVQAALDFLTTQPEQKIFVLGDLAELGKDSRSYHKQIGKQAKQLGVDKLYTCGQSSQLASQAFGKNGLHFLEQGALIAALQQQLGAGTTILVKGSRSAHMENIVSALL